MTDSAAPKSIGYQVSDQKFWIMSLGSFFLWSYWWAFRNFYLLEDPEEKKQIRLLRALLMAMFFRFTYYKLMDNFEHRAREAGFKVSLPKIILAVLYLGLCMIVLFQGPLSQMYLVCEYFSNVLAVFALFQTQRLIFEFNRRLNPDAEYKLQIAGWEIGFLVVGLGFYIATILTFTRQFKVPF